MARTRKPEGMAEVVKRIRDVDDVDPWAKVLVFGPNGSGKTRFCASAPKCLIVEINERGTRSAVNTGSKTVPIDHWPDLGHIYWYLKGGDHPFESVAIDGVTGMQALAMRFALNEAEERDPSRVRDMPDKRSYGKAGQLVSSMTWAFCNLPMHVVLTATPRFVTDQDTGELLDTTVDLPAGCRGSVTGAVSVLGFMKPQEVRVRNKTTRKIETKWVDHMYVGPSNEMSSLKDRTNSLGPVFKRPSMSKIIEVWGNIEPEVE